MAPDVFLTIINSEFCYSVNLNETQIYIFASSFNFLTLQIKRNQDSQHINIRVSTTGFLPEFL